MRALLVFTTMLLVGTARADSGRDIAADFASLLETHRAKRDFPALAAAVVRGTNIVASGVTGVRKAGSPEKVTIDDKFHIGSCTKSITSLLAVYLDADGKVSLTNRVGDILKDWDIPTDAGSIPLKLLLQNLSGLGNKPDPKIWRQAFADTGALEKQRRRFLEAFLEAPLEAKTGTKYIYSNVGYALAGAMLETAARQPWEKLVEKRIFSPLKLETAGFGPPSSTGEIDQPWGHMWKDGEAVPVDPHDNPPAIAPAGRVHMSILDCARYATFHLRAAQGRIPELRDYRKWLYEAPQGSHESSYAFGWIVSERSWARGKVLTHAGSNTMFYTVIWIAPERDFACVVATNVSDQGDLVANACDNVVADIIKRFLLQDSQ